MAPWCHTSDPMRPGAVCSRCSGVGPVAIVSSGFLGDPTRWCWWIADHVDEGAVGPFVDRESASEDALASGYSIEWASGAATIQRVPIQPAAPALVAGLWPLIHLIAATAGAVVFLHGVVARNFPEITAAVAWWIWLEVRAAALHRRA